MKAALPREPQAVRRQPRHHRKVHNSNREDDIEHEGDAELGVFEHHLSDTRAKERPCYELDPQNICHEEDEDRGDGGDDGCGHAGAPVGVR